MALGSNGEFRSLSDDEAFEVLKTVSEIKAPDRIFIAGVGRESLYQTLAFIKRLEEAAVQIDYFTAIADASSYPMLLYCAPGFTNDVRISPEALKALADHPNIAGIKDTTPDMMSAYMDAVGGREAVQEGRCLPAPLRQNKKSEPT